MLKLVMSTRALKQLQFRDKYVPNFAQNQTEQLYHCFSTICPNKGLLIDGEINRLGVQNQVKLEVVCEG